MSENSLKQNTQRVYGGIIIKSIIEYVILLSVIFIGSKYFSFLLFVLPLIICIVNYFIAKDRYELYFLNSGLVIFAIIMFMVALLSAGNVEQSAFGMLFSLIGILEFGVITLILNKLRIGKESLLENEEEKIKLGMVGVKTAIILALIGFIVLFI